MTRLEREGGGRGEARLNRWRWPQIAALWLWVFGARNRFARLEKTLPEPLRKVNHSRQSRARELLRVTCRRRRDSPPLLSPVSGREQLHPLVGQDFNRAQHMSRAFGRSGIYSSAGR